MWSLIRYFERERLGEALRPGDLAAPVFAGGEENQADCNESNVSRSSSASALARREREG